MVHEAGCQPPHKIDENMWKNREQIEEILVLLERSCWPKVVRYKVSCAFNFYICETFIEFCCDDNILALEVVTLHQVYLVSQQSSHIHMFLGLEDHFLTSIQ